MIDFERVKSWVAELRSWDWRAGPRRPDEPPPTMAKPQVRLTSWLLPGIFALVCLMRLLEPYYRGWKVLLVALGGALLSSFIWAQALVRYLALTRERRFGWAQVGDRMVERFTLQNRSFLPTLWAEVQDYSTLPNYSASRGVGVEGNDLIRWHMDAHCTRRGLFTLGPTAIRTGDPFGVFEVLIPYPASTPLLVLPPIIPLPNIQVASGGRAGDGRLVPNAIDRTVNASSVREYVYGDSRRWIHWRTSARRDELFVRMFDGTPAGDWWILLDMNRGVQLGDGDNATEEHAVILAASLSDRGLKNRRAVGLISYGEELTWLPPKSGAAQRWEILRALATISPGFHPLDEVLESARPALGRRLSLVIITPSLSPSWVAALIPFLRQGIVPTVLLLDPVSFGSPKDPKVVTAALNDLGIVHYRITRDLLDRPEARPGKWGTWEWRVLGTGKAVPVQRPAESSWEVLV
ncbi:MAG: DUF58 domain-containing protein [Anaerolineae bacterium]|nr:DUF58 domain-containing protein [Anaerolineae bacterium]